MREAIGLTLQVARALSFAHERGLVHRDVKPQNVLLNEDGQAKVTDFGIARSLDVQGVTQTGTVLGTSDYIAPEQARGQKVDPKTDIYSLGVVLYELLAGEVPFSGDNFVAVAMRHVNEPVPSVLEARPDCPARLDLAIQRAMAKDPDDRFQSMDDFVVELEACLAELNGRADEGATMIVPPARPPRRRAGPRRRARLPLTPLLILLAGALRRGRSIPAASRRRLRCRSLRRRQRPAPVTLQGVATYDPQPGDGAEHDDEVSRATDRTAATGWVHRDLRQLHEGRRRPRSAHTQAGRPLQADRPQHRIRVRGARSRRGSSPTGAVHGRLRGVPAGRIEQDVRDRHQRAQLPALRRLAQAPLRGGKAEISEVTARS